MLLHFPVTVADVGACPGRITVTVVRTGSVAVPAPVKAVWATVLSAPMQSGACRSHHPTILRAPVRDEGVGFDTVGSSKEDHP
jgi:hypothetical protein